MLITIHEARKIMGDVNRKYSDTQIEEILNAFYALCNLIVDEYIKEQHD